jgi:hypothetical protein
MNKKVVTRSEKELRIVYRVPCNIKLTPLRQRPNPGHRNTSITVGIFFVRSALSVVDLFVFQTIRFLLTVNAF